MVRILFDPHRKSRRRIFNGGIMTIGSEFLDQSRKVFRSQKDLADRSIAQLQDAELFWQPDSESNSIAIIMKHMAGNMISRWTDFLTSDGEKPDRNRDGEFVDQFKSRPELMAYWERGWECALVAIEALSPADLDKTGSIRG